MFRNLGWLTSRSGKGQRLDPPWARPQLELLEDRVVPTTFTSFNGTLTIRQTAPANVVTVTENPNSSITVTTTDVLSGPSTVFGVQNIVFYDQTAGATEVDFLNHGGQALPGYVLINGQAAGNSLVVDLGATGSSAASTLTPAFNFNVKGNVLVSNIAATDSTEVNVFNSSLGGSTIQGGGNGSSVIFERDTVRGAVAVNLGIGGNFNGGTHDVAQFALDSIVGNLSVNGANGDEMVAELLTVHGSASVSFSGSNSDIVEMVEAVTVQQNLSITTGDGNDEVVGEIVTVDGSTTINTGNAPTGDIVELVALTELQNLSVTTGSGNDIMAFEAVEVDGSTVLNTGNAAGATGDRVDINSSTFEGAVTITFGNGNDSLFIQSSSGPGPHMTGGSTAFLRAHPTKAYLASWMA
jgi:hypothetical protein